MTRAFSRFTIASLALVFAAALELSSCSDATGFADSRPGLRGRVTNQATGVPVAGARVSIGSVIDTTDAAGRFALSGLTSGSATLHCAAAGFADYEATVAVSKGAVTSVRLTRIEVFAMGDFALYVPEAVDTARGVLLALGGPDTRAFATGGSFGAPVAAAESALSAMGKSYRELAADQRLAILGRVNTQFLDTPESDAALERGLLAAGDSSGHPELATIPIVLYGMSGGGPAAAGYTARNPERVAALFLKVPAAVESLSSGLALHVPTYMVQAGGDVIIDNAALTTVFESNRRAGALWARAMEPGVPHHSLSPAQQRLTLDWIKAVLALRLPEHAGGPLHDVLEGSGWLGDIASGQAWSWAAYPTDRAAASWLPTETTAQQWTQFVGGAPNVPPGPVPDIGGVYDLSGTITGSGAWDMNGTRFTAVLSLRASEGAPTFTGTFTSFQYIELNGEITPVDSGSATGSIALDGHVRLHIENATWRSWYGDGQLGAHGFAGTFGCCDALGGTFNAVRRSGA